MLSYRLLKNHTGILLIGDYTSLRWLHEVVHDVNERSPLVRDKEGMFLSLAYDVRKAYERQREIISPPPHYDEMGLRYGVQVLWPVLLLQQRMLRGSLAYLDHSGSALRMAYLSAISRTHTSSLGDMIVVRVFARVTLTRKFWRACVIAPARTLPPTMRSGLPTISPL